MFTVTVSDPRGGVVPVLVTVIIDPANQVPVATLNQGSPSYSGKVTGSVKATDPDGDTLVYSTADTTKGTVTVTSGGNFTYTPSDAARHDAATGAPGTTTDTFTVTVDDGHGGVLNTPVTVTIKPENTKPANAKATAAAPNPVTGAVAVTASATDKDLDTIVYSAPATTTKGTIANNNDGTFTYTPTAAARAAAASSGTSSSLRSDKFTITIDDGHGGIVTKSVTVKVAPTYTGPTIVTSTET